MDRQELLTVREIRELVRKLKDTQDSRQALEISTRLEAMSRRLKPLEGKYRSSSGITEHM